MLDGDSGSVLWLWRRGRDCWMESIGERRRVLSVSIMSVGGRMARGPMG